MTDFHATTICAVHKDGHTSVAGDGQVTMGEHTIFKANAHKVRRIYGDQVITGLSAPSIVMHASNLLLASSESSPAIYDSHRK